MHVHMPQVSLFVDDITIYIFGFNSEFMFTYCSTISMNWEIDWLAKQRIITKDLNLSLYTKTIDEVDIFKFLGLWIDLDLEWFNHVTQLELKINQNKCTLQNIAKVVGIRNLRQLYYAFINSYVNNRILLWGPMLMQTHLNSIEQNLDGLVKNLFIDEHAYKNKIFSNLRT